MLGGPTVDSAGGAGDRGHDTRGVGLPFVIPAVRLSSLIRRLNPTSMSLQQEGESLGGPPPPPHQTPVRMYASPPSKVAAQGACLACR